MLAIAFNYGLGSRDIVLAAGNALYLRGGSYATQATVRQRFAKFAKWRAEYDGTSDLRRVTLAHLIAYAEDLADDVSEGEFALASAHNYLSAVNVVLEEARQDRACWISPSDYLPRRSYVSRADKSSSDAAVRKAKAILNGHPLGDHVVLLIELQRALGLRYEESAKLNARRAIKEADKTGVVTVVDGTKGGRPRQVPIRESAQMDLLRTAAQAQGKHWSLIPPDKTYAEFRRECYEAIRTTPLPGFHGDRHHYAHRRYWQEVGALPPVAAGVDHGRAHRAYIAAQLGITVAEARELDHHARDIIAEELGHGRRQISNSYLG